VRKSLDAAEGFEFAAESFAEAETLNLMPPTYLHQGLRTLAMPTNRCGGGTTRQMSLKHVSRPTMANGRATSVC